MKLIRDNMTEVPWKCEELKKHVRPAYSPDEYSTLLAQKLLEECAELLAAREREDVLAEAGDVFEVLITMCHRHGYSRDDIIVAADEKYNIRGGFTRGCVLDI